MHRRSQPGSCTGGRSLEKSFEPSMSRWAEGPIVTVFGASGFLGRYAVGALARDGWRVLGASRRPNLAGHLQPMGDVGQIHAVQANVRYANSVRRAVEGRSCRESGRHSGERGSANFRRRACSRRRGGRHSRSRGWGQEARPYLGDLRSAHTSGRIRAQEGEAVVLDQFPGAIVLRPSLVFGPEDQLFNRFAAIARLSPFLPLIAGGRTRVQPVYVGDVAAAIAAASAGRAKPGTTYELGGPHIFPTRELLAMTLSWTGRRRWYLPMPF